MKKTAGLVSLLVLVITSLIGGAAHAACDIATQALGFSTPLTIDATRAGGEPSIIGLPDAKGTLIYSTHAGTTHLLRTKLPDSDFATPYDGSDFVWRSEDNGATWSYVGFGGGPTGPHSLGQGFSDPTLAIDSAGSVYVAGIDLAQVYVAGSSDAGKTWLGRPLDVFLTDREWLAADAPGHLYMNGNMEERGQRLWTSTDGGLTWNVATSAALRGSGPPAPILVQPTTGAVVYPFTNYPANSAVQVFPNARAGDTTTTEIHDMPFRLDAAHGFFNSSATDSAGNIYIAANTDREIRIAYSTDNAQTWQLQTIYRSPDTTKATVLWPWISAGSDGRVAATWLEADRSVPNTDSMTGRYHIHAAQSLNAHGCGAQAPVWVSSAATGIIHDGNICTGGTFCMASGGDRRLGDYFSNAIAADGSLVIAYGQTSDKPNGAISHPGFVRQTSGASFKG